jgi:DNA-binding transcriptional LysR family regulator
MLDLQLLRTFITIAECGGFRSASERLHATQSTVSQQIKRLEAELGRPLFRRTTRSVALTHDGEALLGPARRLLQHEEDLRRQLTSPRLSGTVRLGAVEEVASGALPATLGRFARLYPDVRLEVVVDVSAELIGQVDRNDLDLALAKRPWGTSRGRVVWRDQLVWAASDTFELPADGTMPLALFRGSTVSRVAALEALRLSERPWKIVYTSPSLTGVRAAALAGLAVTPLPRSALCPGLRALPEVRGIPSLPELEFVVVTKPNPDAATAELATLLAALSPSRSPSQDSGQALHDDLLNT